MLHLNDSSIREGDNPQGSDAASRADRPEEPPYISCLILGPQYMLPQFEAYGPDQRILYVHRAKKSVYRPTGEPQLIIKLRPPKTPQDGDTFSVYSVQDDSGTAQKRRIRMSHPSLGAISVNNERIKAVRDWVANPVHPGAAPAPEAAQGHRAAAGQEPPAKKRPTQIRDLQPAGDSSGGPHVGALAAVALSCQVIAVDFCYYPDHYLLYLWDGTDAPPLPLTCSAPPAEPQQQPQPGGGQGTSGGGAAGPSHAPRKRGREDDDEGATAGTAGPLGDGGGSAEVLPPLAPLHRRLLHMPLAAVAQYGGPPAAEDGGDPLAGGVRRSGWEMLSAVLRREEMPVAGSGVPLVLPAASFALTPAAQTAAKAPAGGGGDERPLPLPRPGDWIKVKGVVPRFVQGQLQLVYTAGSSSMQLWEAGPDSELARAYELRLELPGSVGLHAFAPSDPEAWLARAVRPWQALPLRTLRQVLMQQDSCDCTPARVLVRVVAVLHPALAPAGAAAGGAAPDELRLLDRVALPAASIHEEGEDVVGSRLHPGRNGCTAATSLLLQDATAYLRASVLGAAANLFLWHVARPAGPAASAPAAQQAGSMPAAAPPGGATTRAKAAQQQAARVAAHDPVAGVAQEGQQQHLAAAAAAGPHAGGLNHERLLAALRQLADQRMPGGAWMECVLHPSYRDLRNPWQSWVYSLEHTVLRPLPPAQAPGGPGEGAAAAAALGSPAPSI